MVLATRFAACTIMFWWCMLFSASMACLDAVMAAEGGDDTAHAAETQPLVFDKLWLNTDISGALRFDYFSSSRNLDDRSSFPGLTGELQITHTLSDSDQIKFKIRSGMYLSSDQAGVITRTRLVDGYWLSKGDVVDWRIGQQLVRWGRADAINPTDFFTPHDYTIYLPLEEDQRLSIPALRADFHIFESGELSLVIEPSFTPTLVPEPSNNPVQIRSRLPGHTVTRPQVGARYSQTGENLDWSVAGFSGYSTEPLLNFESLTPGGPVFRQFYPKILGIGGDIAHNFGKVGFRAEGAYVYPYDTPPGTGINPYFYFVTGVDRALDIIGLDNWNANVQLVLNYTPDQLGRTTAGNPLVQAAVQQNQTLYNQINRIPVGFTTRIASTWLQETLRTELFTYVTANTTNYFIRPLVTYAVSDQWRLLFGGEYYGGSKLGFFGELRKNQTVFFEVRRDF